jgi:E3 ubiquitin-protein ligase ATL6/9/15/31/42/55
MATVIIVVLVSVFVFVVFFSVYLKRCIREVEQADGSSNSTRTGSAAVALPLPTAAAVSGSDHHHHHHQHHRLPLELQRGGVGQGLNKALVEALPILSFSVVKDLRKRGRSEGSSKESLDCAVCLNEFGKDENLLLRLLPACNHAFHVDCIDVWFQSHSTCPLCRSSLLPIFKDQLTDDNDGGGGAAAAAVTVEEAGSRRISEAQGQNCASGAAARDGRRIFLPESWSSSLTGTRRQSASVEQITAEEEEEEEEGKKVLHLPLCNSRTEKLWTIISSHPCCLCVELFWEAAAAAASANWLIVLLNQEFVVHAIHQEAAAAEMAAATRALSEERRIRGTTAVSQSWHSLAILNRSD